MHLTISWDLGWNLWEQNRHQLLSVQADCNLQSDTHLNMRNPNRWHVFSMVQSEWSTKSNAVIRMATMRCPHVTSDDWLHISHNQVRSKAESRAAHTEETSNNRKHPSVRQKWDVFSWKQTDNRWFMVSGAPWSAAHWLKHQWKNKMKADGYCC